MIERMQRDLEPAESHWTYERLKEALVAACEPGVFRRGIVPFSDLPSSLDIGKFGEKAFQCVQTTAQDGKERGLGMEYVPSERRLVMDRQLVSGTESQVAVHYPKAIDQLLRQQVTRLPSAKRVLAMNLLDRMGLEAKELDAQQRSRQLCEMYERETADGKLFREVMPVRVGNIHSHPVPIPVSAWDFRSLLSTPELRVMAVGRPDGVTEFVMKTEEAVPLSVPESEATARRWLKMIEERIVTAVRQHGIGELEANQRVQAALARSIANKYKLGYYVGEGKILKRSE
jgi:hypothetical protein